MKLKSRKILLFFFILILFYNNIQSQDTAIVKYLPLKVGNVWIYSWLSGKQKITITNTVNANGHIYYQFSISGPACTPCPVQIPSPFLITLDPVRVDSITGNIMMIGNTCPWYNGEIIVDSLKRKMGNQNTNTCNPNYCLDTSMQNVFGVQRKTTQLGYNVPNWWRFRRYAKDIGLLRSDNGCWIANPCIYTLIGCVINGNVYGDTSFPTGLIQISNQVPESFSLFQNYPNPFNPTTKIKFTVPLDSRLRGNDKVMLMIYDVLGREVHTLVNEELSLGTYEVEWDGSNFSSGVYYYTLTTGEYFATKKMLLIK